MADHQQRLYHSLRAESPVSPLVSPLYSEFSRLPQSHSLSTATPPRLATERSNDAYDVSPITMYRASTMSRSGSVSSYSSAYTSTLPSTPANVFPPPQYVAPFGAEQVVSERKRRCSDDEFGRPSTVTSDREEVQFSPGALASVNHFLDYLLYSFLGNAKSTTLTALRPAVRDVLKGRLAAEAIASAEDELQELLGGGEDEEEEMDHRQTVAERNRTWDTELVWKRTRLRVMVYTRLGEVEDDDEERFLQEDELFHHGDRRFSHATGLVSWAAAIFLTSVLEYIAEQALQCAGRAADSRWERQSKNPPRVSMSASGLVQHLDGVTVEQFDCEKVALHSTLGRLWRTWKRSNQKTFTTTTTSTTTRSPTPAAGGNHNFSRRFSRDLFGAAVSPVSAMDESRGPSMAAHTKEADEAEAEDALQVAPPEIPEEEYPEHVLAANIRLPLSSEKQDVDEIEVPGLARDPDDLESVMNRCMSPQLKRRNSEADFSPSRLQRMLGSELPLSSENRDPTDGAVLEHSQKPVLTRQRSSSAPTRSKRRYVESREVGADRSSAQAEIGDWAPNSLPDAAATDADDTKAEAEPGRNVNKLPVSENLDKSKDPRGTIFESAAPASAAAAAAAAALVYGANTKKKLSRESSPAIGMGIEDRDSQKLLARDIKRMSMPLPVPLHEGQRSRRVSMGQPRAPASLVTTDGAENRRSTDTAGGSSTRTLSPKSRNEEANANVTKGQQAERPVGIGVAHTSDEAVSALKQDERHHHARDSFTTPSPQRQSRLIIGSSPSEMLSPLATRDSAPNENLETGVPATTPESFLEKRSLSVSPKAQQSEEAPKSQTAVASQRDGPIAVQRQMPNALTTSDTATALQPSSGVEISPLQQTSSTASEKTSSLMSHAKKPSNSETAPSVVQEQPSVQKMAVKKQQDIRARGQEEFPLTSASIRGPEDFEMFVQGGDTVKYTLTPEHVRDVETSPNTVPLAKLRAQTTPTPTTSERPPSRVGRSLAAKQATPAIPVPPDPEEEREPRGEERRRSSSRPPVRNTSVHRKSGLMAREPQVVTDSTRDFADFIRSTGPDKEQEIYPIISNRASLQSVRQAYILGSRSSSPGANSVRSQNRISAKGESVPPMPPIPRRKSDMQPRGATSTTDSGTSDLIDFIRTGPNEVGKDGEPREHRISRSVAPFRTTMDSDQLQEWGDHIAAQPDLKLNTSVPSVRSASSPKSSSYTNRTSANSRSALLNSASSALEVSQPAYSGQQQRLPSKATSQVGPPEPVVKRYRNKDPYAIDYDDDEGDDFLTALPKGKREEESLIDFLRNTGPSEAAQAASSSKADTRNPPTVGPHRSGASGLQVLGADAVSAGNTSPSAPSRDGHRPRTSISGEVAAKNTTTTVAIGPISKQPPRQKMEARSGTKRENGTGDLADFLRSSGPSPAAATAAATPPPYLKQNSSKASIQSGKTKKSEKSTRKSGSFFGSLFSRKTAPAAGKAYLDM
ncbi:Hypothetical predicted protein [Lecanosticta acicola]|uniref:Uncharacterized protein n=1 Tax=Lecanosticta acicola TaxID=111012 RepID=A0AAI8W0B4_9PEZI|nr:Hypothetical predicted protein [Lecanosticta acicola]